MRFGLKKFSLIVRHVFMTHWCPANRLERYSVMILSAHVSGTAKTTDSFSGVILSNRESNRMCLFH